MMRIQRGIHQLATAFLCALLLWSAATAAPSNDEEQLEALKFVLFVNQPNLLSETYARYLEGRIRKAEPYFGLPVLLSCRARRDNV